MASSRRDIGQLHTIIHPAQRVTLAMDLVDPHPGPGGGYHQAVLAPHAKESYRLVKDLCVGHGYCLAILLKKRCMYDTFLRLVQGWVSSPLPQHRLHTSLVMAIPPMPPRHVAVVPYILVPDPKHEWHGSLIPRHSSICS